MNDGPQNGNVSAGAASSRATRLTHAWKTSSKSAGGNCVEVRATRSNDIEIRDSKNRDGGTLMISHTAWNDFLDGVRSGQFDMDH